MDISALEKALRFINMWKDDLPAAVHSIVVDFLSKCTLISICLYFEDLYFDEIALLCQLLALFGCPCIHLNPCVLGWFVVEFS